MQNDLGIEDLEEAPVAVPEVKDAPHEYGSLDSNLAKQLAALE